MSDTNNFVARGQIVTSAVLRCVSILTAITVCWVFVEFVMGFNWTAKEVGSHLLDLLKHLIPAAATFFFAPFLASIAWLAWPGSRPTLQGALHGGNQVSGPGGATNP